MPATLVHPKFSNENQSSKHEISSTPTFDLSRYTHAIFTWYACTISRFTSINHSNGSTLKFNEAAIAEV